MHMQWRPFADFAAGIEKDGDVGGNVLAFGAANLMVFVPGPIAALE